MNTARVALLHVAVAAALLLSPHAHPAQACASVGPEGTDTRIVQEDALIVWDAETQTEHFVRSATFASTAPGFGFLVPTPTVPDIGAVDDWVFARLSRQKRPEVVTKTDWSSPRLGSWLFPERSFDGAKASALREEEDSAGAVQVLKQARAGVFDAVVLEASSADALAAWLEENGYTKGAALTDWLTPYVELRWKLTAFKYNAERGEKSASGVLRTNAVRLSFQTEQPFYPYREPADQRQRPETALEGYDPSHRSLRLYVVSDGRVEGTLGLSDPWKATTTHAAPVESTVLREAAPSIPSFPKDAWLTVLVDEQAPRPGTDEVYFRPNPTQLPVRDLIVYSTSPVVPIEIVAGVPALGIGAVLAMRRRKRRRRP